MTDETDFRRLSQLWDSRSRQHGESDLSGRRVSADSFYNYPYSCEAIAKREFEILRDSPRPVRPATFLKGFDHNVPLPSSDIDNGNDCNGCDARMSFEAYSNGYVVDERGTEATDDSAYAVA